MKGEKKSRKDQPDEDAAPADAQQWNVDELNGGAARQDKFLRLLGGKKGGAAAKEAGQVSKKAASSSVRAEADIQRQFEAGMKAKMENTGQRRGLGA